MASISGLAVAGVTATDEEHEEARGLSEAFEDVDCRNSDYEKEQPGQMLKGS